MIEARQVFSAHAGRLGALFIIKPSFGVGKPDIPMSIWGELPYNPTISPDIENAYSLSTLPRLRSSAMLTDYIIGLRSSFPR